MIERDRIEAQEPPKYTVESMAREQISTIETLEGGELYVALASRYGPAPVSWTLQEAR
ncbi:MAG: hypothetical protein HC801_10870 [Nitrospira sp.]|nr:hypothetical protein [Nitrospira sp.]